MQESARAGSVRAMTTRAGYVGRCEAERAAWLDDRAALAAVLLVVIFVGFVRFRVADVPLERDEGEYAYAGQLILQGVPPYRLAYNMKFPGTYYAYAAILAVFGSTRWGIHVGLLFVNAATILLVFRLGRRLLGALPAAIAATSFALLSIDRWTLGVFAHATHFVLPPLMGGFLLLLRANESRRALEYFAAGILLGTSVLMKQHAAFFLPLGVGLVVSDDLRAGRFDVRGTGKRLGLLVSGSALPLLILLAVLLAQGVLGRFWFWTFRYAAEYASEEPLRHAVPSLLDGLRVVTRATLLLWITGGLGLVALWVDRWPAATRGFLTAFFAASFLSICPGFYFREHYFILLLPAVGLLGGVAAASTDRLLGGIFPARVARALVLVLVAAAAARYVVAERAFLFSMSARELSRLRYAGNPFVEAVEIARYIGERTGASERIAVLGSEPEIYFYADRRSATGYMYTYPLMESQPYARTMQEEMIQEIESAHPTYLVFVGIGLSWLPRPGSDQTILQWASRYTQACYGLVGIADIDAPDSTKYAWEDGVMGYRPASQELIYTFRRTGDAPCAVSHR
jgi:hypothetical protein